MKNINEKELHELFYKLKIKEKDSYEELYKKYSSLVYKIAFSILKDKENAEDIMQNVFIKIANLPEKKLPSDYEASWLYSVTKNEAISYIRKFKETIPVEEIKEKSKQNEIEDVLHKYSYEELISSLEEIEKQIISLKVEIGLSFKEIASVLNMPIGTVQWKYYKSLHTLKLLIGNLSLFIITGILSISNFMIKESKSINQGSMQEEIEDYENEMILEDKEKQESIQANNRIEEEIIENKKEETNEILEEIIVEDRREITIIDIGLISITSMFLCLTIFFTIIFINNQQNKRKKSSK